MDTVSGELKQWHAVTIDFQGPYVEETPSTFRDYRLNVTFTNEDTGEVMVIPGYFAADGDAANTSATEGDVWRVKFTPPSTGNWTYEASFRTGEDVAVSLDPEAGTATSFDGNTGSLAIVETDKTGEDLRAHGTLQADGDFYLNYAGSGDVFIKSGVGGPESFLSYTGFDNTESKIVQGLDVNKDYDPHIQDFNEGDPTWGDGQGEGIIGAVNYLGDTGINAIYLVINSVAGDSQNIHPWSEDLSTIAARDVTGHDPALFQSFDVSKLAQWDIVFQHMEENGIAIQFLFGEAENQLLLNDGEVGLERMLYMREILARFGHNNSLIYNFGEEFKTTRIGKTHQTLVDQAEYFNALDAYDHPLAIHTNPGTPNTRPILEPELEEDAWDVYSMQQNDYQAIPAVIEWRQKYIDNGTPTPIYWDEAWNSRAGFQPDTNPEQQAEQRAFFWGVMLNGGAGVSWYPGFGDDLHQEDFRTRDIAYTWTVATRKLFEQLPLNDMNPEHDVTTSTTDYVFAQLGEIYIIYLANGGGSDLDLSGYTGEYDVVWFNPRADELGYEGTVTTVQAGGVVDLGLPPTDTTEDWAIIVRKSGEYRLEGVDTPRGDNEDPIANDDSALAVAEGPVTIDVLGNDRDPENSALQVQSVEDPANGTTQIVDGQIVYTPDAGFSGTETFEYTIVDPLGATDTGQVTVDVIGARQPGVIGQTGAVSVSQISAAEWHGVTFDSAMDDAIVVASVVTVNDGDPVHVRVRNVTEIGFEFQLEEWIYQDVVHGVETISWTAVERGVHTLADGAVIQAGSTDFDEIAANVTFDQAFGEAPVVIGQVASEAGTDESIDRVFDVSASGFSAVLHEEEGRDGAHAIEDFHWIAFQSGTHESFAASTTAATDQTVTINVDPGYDGAALTDIQTNNESDTASVRLDISGNGADLFIQEEQSADTETTHSSETVGFVQTNAILTTNPINEAPVPVDDAATTDFGEAVAIDVLGNDSDPDGDALSLQSVDDPANGSAVIQGGQIVYTPDAGFSGTETFSYVVADLEGATSTASVTVTVADEPPVTEVPVNAAAAFVSTDFDQPDAVDAGQTGEAVIRVLPGAENIQLSNFGNNSFTIENVGDKRIVGAYIDVEGALYGDAVFDPDGTGGDNVTKPLQINMNGGTEVISPDDYDEFFQATDNADNPLFADGVAQNNAQGGFRGLLLKFAADGTAGFTNGETVGFSIDMDPNSIAGWNKGIVDTLSFPTWDVGGISGAELIGSEVTILFADGTTATSQLMSDGSQAGSQTLATQASPDLAASVTVNGTEPGETGTYDGQASVIVEGPAGATIRVVLTKGIQPAQNTAQNVGANVDARLADEDFAVNNAIEFQVVDITLGAGETSRDISDLFVYDNDPNGYAFEGNDQLPLGFVASVIDPANEDLPLGPVSAPIYLTYDDAAVNAAPTAGDDDASTGFGAAVTIDVLTNDSDPEGGALTIQSVDDPANGTAQIVNGQILYTPDAGFAGIDTFTYAVADPEGETTSATVSVTVSGAANTPPNAANDTAATDFGEAVTIDVLSNDSDPEGGALTIQSVANPMNGSAQIVGNQIVYMPDAGFSGTETFNYIVADPEGALTSANVTVTVAEEPVDPEGELIGQTGNVSVAQDSANQWHSVTFDEAMDDPIVAASVITVNDGDPVHVRLRNVTDTGFEFQLEEWVYQDGVHGLETVSWTAVERGVHTLADGSVIQAGSTGVDHTTSNVAFSEVFDAAPVVIGQVATEIGAHEVTDRIFDVDTDGFSVLLQEEENRDGTHAVEDFHWIAFESGSHDSFAASLVAADEQAVTFGVDTSFDGAALTDIQSFTGGDTAAVRVEVSGGTAEIYVEEEQSANTELNHSVEQIAWVQTDAVLRTGSGSGNQSPVAVDDTVSTDEDQAITIDVLANDSDPEGGALTLQSVTGAANGTAVILNGGVVYTPNVGFTGTETLEYVVADPTGATSTASVTVNVASNAAPVAADDSATTGFGQSIVLDVLENDSDPDGDALNIQSVANPANGTASIVNGAIFYTPDAGFFGTESFDYTIADALGKTATGTVTVEVDEQGPVQSGNLIVNGSFEENEVTNSKNWQTFSNLNGWTHPNAAELQENSARFAATASDGDQYLEIDAGSGGSPDSIYQDVQTVAGQTYQLSVDAAWRGSQASSSVEVYWAGALVDVIEPVSSTTFQTYTFSLTGTGGLDRLEFREPAGDNNGSGSLIDNVILTTDGGGPTNAAPIAVGDTAVTDEGQSIIIDVLENDSDPDGDALSLASVGPAGNGQTSIQGNQVVYTPSFGFTGQDSFEYTVIDTAGNISTAAVELTVEEDDSVEPEGPLSLLLVNAATDEVIDDITDGVINPALLDGSPYSIEARYDGEAGSISFSLSTGFSKTESVAPYSLFGDIGGDFFGRPLPNESFSGTVTVFEEAFGNGAAVAEEDFLFTFSDLDPA